MRKTITSIALALISLTVSAKDYFDVLVVTVNGVESKQGATISVEEQADGTATLSLLEFTFGAGDNIMPVGNIILSGVPVLPTADFKKKLFEFNGDVNITAPEDGGLWTGPMLGAIPLRAKATYDDSELRLLIDIDLSATLNQVIHVDFGSGYTLPNSGFENFHTATLVSPDPETPNATSDEPNGWHSFMSASGDETLAWLAGYNPHTFISDEVRPGSAGTHSVLVTSLDMLIAIANGTITTGRINAGSMNPLDYENHAWMDLSSSEADASGYPFAAAMKALPDSIAVWVKFKQSKPNADHPYATLTATITDGSYYQEPSETEYTNVVGRAACPTIESKDFAWQRISVPFDYNIDMIGKQQAIMVTLSTNADPGAGSTDSLYVDDIELIYCHKLESFKLGDTEIELTDGDENTTKSLTIDTPLKDATMGFESSLGSVITVQVEDDAADANKHTITVNVYGADLSSKSTYTFDVTSNEATGIKSVSNGPSAGATYYNLSGRKVNGQMRGLLIRQNADGSREKVINK